MINISVKNYSVLFQCSTYFRERYNRKVNKNFTDLAWYISYYNIYQHFFNIFFDVLVNCHVQVHSKQRRLLILLVWGEIFEIFTGLRTWVELTLPRPGQLGGRGGGKTFFYSSLQSSKISPLNWRWLLQYQQFL